MVISNDPLWGPPGGAVVREYEDAVVYGDFEQERVLHEGPVRVLDNGWVELPTARLLSPEAVHHVDVPPELPDDEADAEQKPGARRERDSQW